MWWPGTELNRRRQPFQNSYDQCFQQLQWLGWDCQNTGKYEKNEWVVGDSKAQESSIEACECLPWPRLATPAMIPSFDTLPETLTECVQKASLHWRLQLAESKWPDRTEKLVH